SEDDVEPQLAYECLPPPEQDVPSSPDRNVIDHDQDDRHRTGDTQPCAPLPAPRRYPSRHRYYCRASPLRIALARSAHWQAAICPRTCAAKGSSLAPRMRAASRPALRAPPTETVATGTPAGICTSDSSESIPSRCWSGTGTPITGKGVR